MSKARNAVTWGRFQAVLHGEKYTATKRGFRMRDGRMHTYEQQKVGLSAYYDKRYVLRNGIHTEPLEYHIGAPG